MTRADPPDEQLAAVIRRLRAERGMSQEALAFAAGITIASVSRIERGEADPQWTTVKQLANGFGLRPAELVAMVERS